MSAERSSQKSAVPSERPTGPLLYVSWGGTGRGASVREAMREAVEQQRPLHYLAVLDDEHFADLDHSMIALLIDELRWLLEAQLELTRAQVGADDLDVSIVVRAGQVVDLVAETVDGAGETDVLIGAPVPVAGHHSIEEQIGQIASRTGSPVRLVLPDEPD